MNPLHMAVPKVSSLNTDIFFLLKTAPSLKHTQLDSQLPNCAVTMEAEGKGFLWSTASCQFIVINGRKWLEARNATGCTGKYMGQMKQWQLQNLGPCIRAWHHQVELAGLPVSSWKEVNPRKQHKTNPKSTKSKEQILSQEALSDFPLLVELCWIQIFCSSVSSRDVVWSTRQASTDNTGHCTAGICYHFSTGNSNAAIVTTLWTFSKDKVKDGKWNHFLIREWGMCRGGNTTYRSLQSSW